MKNSSSLKRKPSSSRQPSFTPERPDKKLKMNGEIQEISLKKKTRKPNNEVPSIRRILRGDSTIEEEKKMSAEQPNETNHEKESDLAIKSKKETRSRTNKRENTNKNSKNKDIDETGVSPHESSLALNSENIKKNETNNNQGLNGKTIKRGEDPTYKRILRKEKNTNEKSVETEKIEISISPVERKNVEIKTIVRKKQQRINENLEKYNIAIQKLQENSLSDCIPCREKEKKQIYDFLSESLISEGSSHFLYIYGVPGIGKTISFLEVVRNLQKDYDNKFLFIHLNGMNLANPENAYPLILKEISQAENIPSKNASCIILNDIFTKNKIPRNFSSSSQNLKKVKIILLDELDYFLTKDQQLLYNLLEWLQHSTTSKLIMAGIANTMDFPEKLLPKVASRMGSLSLPFKPYSSNQIEEIVRERTKTLTDVFDSDSLTFVGKKIAVNSSDIRRTLNVVRKAAELAMETYQDQIKKKEFNGEIIPVKIDHIRKSYEQVYSSPYHQALKNLSKWQKLSIITLAIEIKLREKNYAIMTHVYERFYSYVITNWGPKFVLKRKEMENIFWMLSEIKLISIKERLLLNKGKEERVDPNDKSYYNLSDYQIEMNITLDDLKNSLIDDEIYDKEKGKYKLKMSLSFEDRRKFKNPIYSPIPKKAVDLDYSTFSEKKYKKDVSAYQPRKLHFTTCFTPEKSGRKNFSEEIERSNNPLSSDKKFLEENERNLRESLDFEVFLNEFDLKIK